MTLVRLYFLEWRGRLRKDSWNSQGLFFDVGVATVLVQLAAPIEHSRYARLFSKGAILVIARNVNNMVAVLAKHHLMIGLKTVKLQQSLCLESG